MKKTQKALACLLFSFPFLFSGLSAQVTWKFNSALQSGYEHNPFRNPAFSDSNSGNSDEENDEEGEDEADGEAGEFEEGEENEGRNTTPSAPFTQLTSAFQLKQKTKRQELRWDTDVRGTAYFGLPEANQFQGSTQLQYGLNLSQNTQWLSRGSLTILRGANAADRVNVFRFNFSYVQADAATGLKFRLPNKHTLRVLATYRFKNYETAGDWLFRYQAFGLEGRALLMLDPDRAFRKRLLLILSATDRFYNGAVTGLPEEGELGIADSSDAPARNWLYTRARAEYQMDIAKRLRIAPFVAWTGRHDLSGTGFGFAEGKVGLKAALTTESFRAQAQTSVAYRHYPNQNAGEDAPLQYLLARVSGDVGFALGRGLWLNAGGRLIARHSNNASTTVLSRRSYMNYQVWAGISFDIKGKRK
ncbi:MAG: hypothetical protein AAF570_01910 [Bacteroidota bacterium]